GTGSSDPPNRASERNRIAALSGVCDRSARDALVDVVAGSRLPRGAGMCRGCYFAGVVSVSAADSMDSPSSAGMESGRHDVHRRRLAKEVLRAVLCGPVAVLYSNEHRGPDV